MKAVKSQLEAMSGVTPATTNPTSPVARFVFGDIKGGDAAHAYRMTVIRTAILESFKGNLRNLQEAVALVSGKAKKARAYAAGFEVLLAATDHDDDGKAIPMLRKLPYVGKWDSKDNASLRTKADTLSDALAAQFDSAFKTIMAEKAAPKAKAKAKVEEQSSDAADAVAAALKAAADAEAKEGQRMEVVTEQAVIEYGALVETVSSAIAGGLLLADELAAIREALAAYDAAQTLAAINAIAGAPTEQAAAATTATAH